MGTTPAGLRYPEPTDRVADTATHVRNLAEDVGLLGRLRLVKLTAPSGELDTSTTANVWTDVANADFTMPASIPKSESATSGHRLVVAACVEGMWTGGAGGPMYRWLLNGAQNGQVRFLWTGQNAYHVTTILDYVTPPAAGANVTLRFQHASGSSIVCRSRNAICAVFVA